MGKARNIADSNLSNLTVDTTTLVIDATNNNVGIGTTSTSGYKLAVSDGTTFSVVHAGGGASYYGAITNNPVLFITNNTERMRIDSSGNLLVGTTSADGKVDIESNGTTGQYCLNINDTSAGTSSVIAVDLKRNGTRVGSISVSGSNTTYSTSSDYRLKDITGDLTGYKERIMALQPKQGSWKVDGSVFKGFIAHEFAEQYPNAVSGEKDAVDAEGKPMYQGMQAGGSETIADLVALAKEQQAIITDLKARIEAIESK